MTPRDIEVHYRRAIAYLDARDWPAAEGLLLQLREQVGPADLRVADALAYALLMQGAYGACERVLQTVLDHPDRSFWIAHKHGDALRGLQHGPEAISAYRRALREGSTSPLTARNLLQVLYSESPDLALKELGEWAWPLQPWLLEGAQAAAALVAGLDLTAWLQERGLATPQLQRRLAEQRLYSLQRPDVDGPNGAAGRGAALMDPDLPWCRALSQRLEALALSPVSIPGP